MNRAMLKMKAILLLAATVVALLAGPPTDGQSPDMLPNGRQVAKALRPILAKLSSGTAVPLRLPSYIPFSSDPKNPVYSSLSYLSESSYEVELSWSQDCSGGNSCHLGTIRGSKGSDEQQSGGSLVWLRPGLKGHFTPAVCGGAGCTDSTISWSEGGFVYSMSIKAGKETYLAKMARSALEH